MANQNISNLKNQKKQHLGCIIQIQLLLVQFIITKQGLFTKVNGKEAFDMVVEACPGLIHPDI